MWLLCNGGKYIGDGWNTFSALKEVLHKDVTYFGNGLPLPDLQGKTIFGYESGYTANEGESGGRDTISVDQMPSHDHEGHDTYLVDYAAAWAGGGGYVGVPPGESGHGFTNTGQYGVRARGGGQPYIPPHYAYNYIIFTGYIPSS
jgi:hypothetical protein